MHERLTSRPETQAHLERLRSVAREKIAPRAAAYDRATVFPRDNFADLHAAGLLAPTIGLEHGGMGLGPHLEDARSLWMMTGEVARADMATARIWEGHSNALLLMEALASPEQKARWFPGIVQDGRLWSAWSGEPLTPTPEETQRFGTQVTETDEGYIVHGTKVFCTGATGCDYAILLVNPRGAGGARHATDGADSVIMLACDLSDPSVATDGAWWDPIGMRATVSHLVRFDQTFIPAANLIGRPGQFLKEHWQTRFTANYVANFLGGAEAAYDHVLKHIGAQGKGRDPYVQQRVGKMSINIETGKLWLGHVSDCWASGDARAAALAGNRARYLVEQLAMETVQHGIHACGARSLNRPSPLERIYRDLTFYTRHDNDDHVLATIGQSVLGLDHDASFFRTSGS